MCRDALMIDQRKYDIIGGIISPVHDSYGKKSLIDAKLRLEMCKRAVADSDWVDISAWEISQSGWTTTAQVIKTYIQLVNESKLYDEPVLVRLIMGADVLESMLVPGLWSENDIEFLLGTSGVTVVNRVGFDLQGLISSKFAKYQDTIDIVQPSVQNNVSSTLVRNRLKENKSVKYLIPDAVYDFIVENQLFQCTGRAYASKPVLQQKQQQQQDKNSQQSHTETGTPNGHL
jgi:nicotinate (nicotinamide) nucleotide adenylyltransferase